MLLPVDKEEEENAKSDKGMARDARCLYNASAPQKSYPGNPYTVTNINDVWEIDILDLLSSKKYNDSYKYIYYK